MERDIHSHSTTHSVCTNTHDTLPQTAVPADLNPEDASVIRNILANEDFYARLGVDRNATTQQIRRAYLRRSKFSVCLSTAYTTLSEPLNRRQYDLFGRAVDGSEHTFADALQKVFDEFMEGQYDTLMALVDQIQSLNPELHINKEGARFVLSSMREFCLWSGKCWGAAKFELIYLYEIHLDIQALSYFDFKGRLMKTAALSKGLITLMAKMVPAGNLIMEESLPTIERVEMYMFNL
ncbi:hypothetical protein PhCBS80983_g03488 [Powellomyces hirtus]|uniref:J domain-containing protein n=1 Tax=Powellomyces hirtus TaxID=109895 RepID=A0A507E433_9FUNG|nr:hypothetical protein PhCBS80983_g03488 [Powellomyces hirtus]